MAHLIASSHRIPRLRCGGGALTICSFGTDRKPAYSRSLSVRLCRSTRSIPTSHTYSIAAPNSNTLGRLVTPEESEYAKRPACRAIGSIFVPSSSLRYSSLLPFGPSSHLWPLVAYAWHPSALRFTAIPSAARPPSTTVLELLARGDRALHDGARRWTERAGLEVAEARRKREVVRT